MSEPYFSEVTLYKNIGTTWRADKNGLNVALKDRSLFSDKPAFSITIPKNTTKTFYVKANSKLTTSGEFKIYTEKYFNSIKAYYYDLLYMFYFGAIFIVSVLNLFIFTRLKEPLYLYYSGYTFFYTLWISAYSGLILYTPIDGYYHKFIMVTSMFLMFLILFSSEFLNVKKYLPKTYKALNIFALSFGLLALLIVISFEPWFEVMNALASVVFLVLFSVAIYILRKNNDINIKYYLFAMSLYMITISLMSAMVNGWIENNDINRYSFLFGSFIEIIFFALLLTNRFYVYQKEKLNMQDKLIKFQAENETILEKKIKTATNDISELVNEKELLLKELYHRVKNNFHMIIGLLWIEEENAKDKNTKDSYLKIISRIKSMSMVNRYLYDNDSLSEISSKELLHEIIDEVKKIYSDEIVSINENIDSFFIEIDVAIQLATIVNELLNNSIKHSKKDKDCIIDFSLIKTGTNVTFVFQDNGDGFDSNSNSDGIGLKLISQYSKKLSNADYNFSFSNGTKFELTFTMD